MPQLSICIATMNRAAFLRETLDGLLAQATDDVEIVILDGGSSDGTEALGSLYASRSPLVRYFRQSTNMGVDRDFDNAVQKATGTYCWLMSDDDLLKPGAIARVLAEIARGFDLIVVNAEARTTEMSEVLTSSLLKFNSDHEYGPGDGDRLLAEVGSYLSFIGGVVINRRLWNARAREPYYGSLFIHVGVIFQGPLTSALAIADPLIVIRYGNAMWTSRAFEIWMFKWPWLIWSFPWLGDAAKARVTPREPWRKASTLLLFRARGAYAAAEYRRWLRPLTRSMAERLKLGAIARLPGLVAHSAVTIYLSLRHPEPAVALFELQHSPFRPANYFAGLRRLFTRKA
jgi:abequosyltransferase